MSHGNGPWLAWWQLLRAANGFTAASNVIAGFLLVNGQWQPIGALGVLIIASVSLYVAGMVLNDVCDVEQDRVERPHRPIPSGRVSRIAALAVAVGLMAVGLAAAGVASWLVGHWTPLVIAGGLVAAIVAYDRLTKATWFGPPNMGLCRFLNVLLGASIASALQMEWAALLVATGVGVYTWGLTLVARREAAVSVKGELLAGCGLLATGLLLVSLLPLVLAAMAIPTVVWIAAFGLLFFLGRQVILPIFSSPSPDAVQAAVKRFILMFVGIDAAVSGAAAGWVAAVVVLCLLVPMRLMARRTPMT